MKNIISVSTNTYHGFSMDEALEGIAAAGFKYVELTAVKGWTEHVMPGFPEAELIKVEKKLKDSGLTCIALSGHCNLMDAERLNDFRENIKLAHRLGCKYIISSAGEAHFGKGESFADEVLIRNIKSIVPDLEKYDLCLGIEVHGAYGTGESLYRIYKGVGSDRVGINYDTANVVFYGGQIPNNEIRNCVDGINYMHLKDKVGFDKVWNFPAIGSGDLDLTGLMDYVDANGYTGPISIEIEFTEEFTMRPKVQGDLATADKAVKDSFDYLKSKGII
ncbi:MAG: sugar phosphate isomerase/epimerase [Eubacteriales bacterium]